MWMLSFPNRTDADPWTGLDRESDVREALEEECRKVAEDDPATFFGEPPSDAELDLFAARAAGDMFAKLWPCPTAETAKLPDGVTVRLTCED